jgi:hypothetical protein
MPISEDGLTFGGSVGSPSSGDTGGTGTPGSIWRVGAGAPSNSTGVDTDLWLDGATGDVYQRSGGLYALMCNIRGPAGPTGATGPAGPQGPPGTGTTTDTSVPANALLGADGADLLGADTDYLTF